MVPFDCLRFGHMLALEGGIGRMEVKHPKNVGCNKEGVTLQRKLGYCYQKKRGWLGTSQASISSTSMTIEHPWHYKGLRLFRDPRPPLVPEPPLTGHTATEVPGVAHHVSFQQVCFPVRCRSTGD